MTWLLSLGIVMSISIFIMLWEYVSNKYPLIVSKICQIIFVCMLLLVLTVLVHQAIWG